MKAEKTVVVTTGLLMKILTKWDEKTKMAAGQKADYYPNIRKAQKKQLSYLNADRYSGSPIGGSEKKAQSSK